MNKPERSILFKEYQEKIDNNVSFDLIKKDIISIHGKVRFENLEGYLVKELQAQAEYFKYYDFIKLLKTRQVSKAIVSRTHSLDNKKEIYSNLMKLMTQVQARCNEEFFYAYSDTTLERSKKMRNELFSYLSQYMNNSKDEKLLFDVLDEYNFKIKNDKFSKKFSDNVDYNKIATDSFNIRVFCDTLYETRVLRCSTLSGIYDKKETFAFNCAMDELHRYFISFSKYKDARLMFKILDFAIDSKHKELKYFFDNLTKSVEIFYQLEEYEKFVNNIYARLYFNPSCFGTICAKDLRQYPSKIVPFPKVRLLKNSHKKSMIEEIIRFSIEYEIKPYDFTSKNIKIRNFISNLLNSLLQDKIKILSKETQIKYLDDLYELIISYIHIFNTLINSLNINTLDIIKFYFEKDEKRTVLIKKLLYSNSFSEDGIITLKEAKEIKNVLLNKNIKEDSFSLGEKHPLLISMFNEWQNFIITYDNIIKEEDNKVKYDSKIKELPNFNKKIKKLLKSYDEYANKTKLSLDFKDKNLGGCTVLSSSYDLSMFFQPKDKDTEETILEEVQNFSILYRFNNDSFFHSNKDSINLISNLMNSLLQGIIDFIPSSREQETFDELTKLIASYVYLINTVKNSLNITTFQLFSSYFVKNKKYLPLIKQMMEEDAFSSKGLISRDDAQEIKDILYKGNIKDNNNTSSNDSKKTQEERNFESLLHFYSFRPGEIQAKVKRVIDLINNSNFYNPIINIFNFYTKMFLDFNKSVKYDNKENKLIFTKKFKEANEFLLESYEKNKKNELYTFLEKNLDFVEVYSSKIPYDYNILTRSQRTELVLEVDKEILRKKRFTLR